MIASRFAVALAGALVAFAPAAAWADLIAFAPTGYHFSVQFPANPTFQPADPAKQQITLWKGYDGGFVYLATARDAQEGYDTTFQSDLNDFVKATNATIVEQHAIAWTGPSGPVTGLRAEFRMPNGAIGESEYVLEGRRYLVGLTVLDRSGTARRDAMLAFLSSLKFTD